MKTSIEEVNEAAGTLYLLAQAYATQSTPPKDGFYVASAALVAVADPGSSESAAVREVKLKAGRASKQPDFVGVDLAVAERAVAAYKETQASQA